MRLSKYQIKPRFGVNSSCEKLKMSLTSIAKRKQGNYINAPSSIKILLYLLLAFYISMHTLKQIIHFKTAGEN